MDLNLDLDLDLDLDFDLDKENQDLGDSIWSRTKVQVQD